jgi:DNA-binding CsgD family transcriptional regulator
MIPSTRRGLNPGSPRRGRALARVVQSAEEYALGEPSVVGRADELSQIGELLDRRDRLPAAALVVGEAGIGKTTVWLAATARAVDRGYRVLSTRPSEVETGYSFSGLADFVADVADEVSAALPPPQRRALDAALLRESDEGSSVEERVVAAAFLGTLRALADRAPVVVAVDDVQWLDAPSQAVLRFALARLRDEPVAALLTARGDPPDWIRRTVAEERLTMIELRPLSVGALQDLLRARLGRPFTRPVLLRLSEASGGNPFFALELARALERRGGRIEPGRELPLPSTLEALIDERLEMLTPEAEEVCRVAAALAEPTARLVEASVDRGATGVEVALRAHVLEVDGERIRFTHPLLASAIAGRMAAETRRMLHGRLAALVTDPEERAHHLALEAIEPDARVANALDGAARRARARGAATAAAELAEQARRLTPPVETEEIRRRTLITAELLFEAGDAERASAILEEALDAAPAGPPRATVLRRLAQVQAEAAGPKEAAALYRSALDEVGADARLEAEIHLELADVLRFATGLRSSEPHAAAAVRAAERSGDREVLCRALSVFGLVRFKLGHGVNEAVMARAVALEEELGLPLRFSGAKGSLCDQRFWSHDLDAARSLAEELRDAEYRREGYADSEGLWYLALIEWRAGTWARAAELAEEVRAIEEQLGRGGLSPVRQWPSALIAAHRGSVGEARARASAALARAEEEGIGTAEAGHRWVLGFLDLSLGAAPAAVQQLRTAHEVREAVGHGEPGQMWELPDLLDALVTVGDVDEAESLAARWEQRGRTVDRAWALAISARTRALVRAARGDLDGSFVAFDEALVEHERTHDPFQHARTLLALGMARRRAKQRASARGTLEEALGVFEQLGAPLWAEKARAELGRIGGRVPSGATLTPGEERIALLVAEGRTNREVAAALFLTEHTVEAALTRVYRKLGVRSRTELAHRLARA